ncbi:MAG: pitrilysin family protein [Rhodospirillales bacterium]|nr:pitrilysin family protein [Rhodospirillales bacterium]
MKTIQLFWVEVLFFAVSLLLILSITLPAQAITAQQVTSPGGIKAWFVADHTNPILTVKFTFRGGAALDPVGKEGLSNLVSGLLDEGAGDLKSTAFQQTLEDLAIGLSFSSGRDEFGGRMKTLVRNQDMAFKLLRLSLSNPRFDTEPVERIRSQILVGLKQNLEDPHSIASQALFKTLYPTHAYGRPTNGTIGSVEGLKAIDLRAFVQQRLAKDNLIIGVVGDISAEELGKRLDTTFGLLPAKAAPWKIEKIDPISKGQTIVINRDIPQSSILVAEKGLMREDPDFYAAYVLNHMFGGGSFTSRLYTEIREKRGLVYSVSTGLYPFDNSALILGSAGTANKRAHETLSVIKTEWDKMAARGVSKKELNDAKTYLTGSFPLRFSSSGRIASMLVGMQSAQLPIDYLQTRNSLIEAVTKDDIKRVAKKLLKSENLVIIVVGRPDGIKSTN